MNKTNRYKTVKISNADFITLNSLQYLLIQKKKFGISKKNILGWAIRKAWDDLLKYEKNIQEN